jgi:O-antigen ligase
MFIGFFVFLFLCFFTYLAWRNLLWAVAFIIAFLPSYLIRFSIGPFPMTLLEGMVLILFVGWLVKSLRGAPTQSRGDEAIPRFSKMGSRLLRSLRSLARTNWWLLIAAWLTVATIALFVAPDLRAAAGIWKAYFIEPILFLIVFLNVVKEKKDLELIFYALGFSAFYVSAFAIYQKFTGLAIPNPIWQAAETRRVTSLYGYPNAIGLYLAPIVTLYFGWLINKLQITNYKSQINYKIQNPKKILVTCYLLLVIASSMLAIVFARSEGAYVGILAGLFFLGVLTKKLRWPTVALAAGAVIIVLFVPQFKNYVWQQISFQNDSGKVRLIQWQETWEMLKDQPLLGAGLAGYQETFAPYHKAKHIEIYLYPHNLFLNFWSEVGLGGLLIFILIVVQFFYSGFKKLFKNWKLKIENFKNNKALQLAILASMTTLLIHGLVDVPYLKNDLSILFWLIIGFSLLTSNSPKTSKPIPSAIDVIGT